MSDTQTQAEREATVDTNCTKVEHRKHGLGHI